MTNNDELERERQLRAAYRRMNRRLAILSELMIRVANDDSGGDHVRAITRRWC